MEKTASRKDIPPRRRKQILDAARGLFSVVATMALPVDAIAERAGISKGNLYCYFKSNGDILHLLFDDIVEHLTMTSWDIIEGDTKPQDKLRAIARSQLEAAESNPEAASLMLQIAGQQELNEYDILWLLHMDETLYRVADTAFCSHRCEEPGSRSHALRHNTGRTDGASCYGFGYIR